MSRRKIQFTETTTYAKTITKCDLCGEETEPGRDWKCKYFERHETTIEGVFGEVYNDDDQRTKFYLDICPTCFETKFIPGVEKLFGIKFTEAPADEY